MTDRPLEGGGFVALNATDGSSPTDHHQREQSLARPHHKVADAPARLARTAVKFGGKADTRAADLDHDSGVPLASFDQVRLASLSAI